ncbi:hypothetical protein AURDEDRAFT_177556 [Auricularia subglabra TFB-10046 SS5]|uniref:C2H2-type domain-containing protein n=1 Tax=Auricularia subglabra (strain TFB-10046 / SS5) TaxID=717982 RepID=J0CSV0_AURST|nr:hypothetical protein AURDEDRAFT_177556 [Auricularia subglabra TFB-10046 SS5]
MPPRKKTVSFPLSPCFHVEFQGETFKLDWRSFWCCVCLKPVRDNHALLRHLADTHKMTGDMQAHAVAMAINVANLTQRSFVDGWLTHNGNTACVHCHRRQPDPSALAGKLEPLHDDDNASQVDAWLMERGTTEPDLCVTAASERHVADAADGGPRGREVAIGTAFETTEREQHVRIADPIRGIHGAGGARGLGGAANPVQTSGSAMPSRRQAHVDGSRRDDQGNISPGSHDEGMLVDRVPPEGDTARTVDPAIAGPAFVGHDDTRSATEGAANSHGIAFGDPASDDPPVVTHARRPSTPGPASGRGSVRQRADSAGEGTPSRRPSPPKKVKSVPREVESYSVSPGSLKDNMDISLGREPARPDIAPLQFKPRSSSAGAPGSLPPPRGVPPPISTCAKATPCDTQLKTLETPEQAPTAVVRAQLDVSGQTGTRRWANAAVYPDPAAEAGARNSARGLLPQHAGLLPPLSPDLHQASPGSVGGPTATPTLVAALQAGQLSAPPSTAVQVPPAIPACVGGSALPYLSQTPTLAEVSARRVVKTTQVLDGLCERMKGPIEAVEKLTEAERDVKPRPPVGVCVYHQHHCVRDALSLICGREQVCMNHFAAGELAVGHTHDACPLDGQENVKSARLPFAGLEQGVMQIKNAPPGWDIKYRAGVCYWCFLPNAFHRKPKDCHHPDRIPQLMFMLYIRQRDAMAASADLPEFDHVTSFEQFWKILKLADDDGCPNIYRYIVWAAATLGRAAWGLNAEER